MLSLIEDVTSTGLSVVAIALPVLALLLVIAMFAAAWTAIRRLRRRLASRREAALPPAPGSACGAFSGARAPASRVGAADHHLAGDRSHALDLEVGEIGGDPLGGELIRPLGVLAVRKTLTDMSVSSPVATTW